MRHRNPRGRDKNKEVKGDMVQNCCHQMSYLRLKCTQFDFGWGSAPDPAGGAHSAPPHSLTGFEGVLLLREGKGMGGKGREGEGKEERGKEEKGEGEGGERSEAGKVASWLLGGMDAPVNS